MNDEITHLDFGDDGVELLAGVLNQFGAVGEFHEGIGLEGFRRPVEKQAVDAFVRERSLVPRANQLARLSPDEEPQIWSLKGRLISQRYCCGSR
jgi:hypothetical protein